MAWKNTEENVVITRRAALAGTSLLGVFGAQAQSAPTIRLGVLNDQSSTYRDNGGPRAVACLRGPGNAPAGPPGGRGGSQAGGSG